MNSRYIVKSKKIVTVSEKKTIYDGAIVINEGKIIDIGPYEDIKYMYPGIPIEDFGDLVITPALVDCHTHLLEYAPSTVYPVTKETYGLGQQSLFLKSLMAGIVTVGEQVCGSPNYSAEVNEYKKIAYSLPLNIVFSSNSITIGFSNLINFTSVTGENAVEKEDLVNEKIIYKLIENSQYPGENIFINASPANLTSDIVPRAGEVIYTEDELKFIVDKFHKCGKKIGCHVAGEASIEMAITSGFDVIHHGHGLTERQMDIIKDKEIYIVATPLGGTHLKPNSPEEICKMVQKGILVAIATDAYLPPYDDVSWLRFENNSPKGPESLMNISAPSIKELMNMNYDENEVLKLITLNGAKVLGIDEKIGSLDIGKDADFIVCKGIPGLDIDKNDDIIKVYFKGTCLIDKNM